MDPAERLAFVVAAVQAVAPELLDATAQEAPASGEQLLEWGARADPAGLLARLSDDQRADVGRVLDGMLRERARCGFGR